MDNAEADFNLNGASADDGLGANEDIAIPAGTGPITSEALIEMVMSGLKRKLVPREMVEQAVAALELSKVQPRLPSPRLRVERLIFTGEKRLGDAAPVPFQYNQEFAPGVNVVFIEDNDVGKSSILKTIKYGLTGDDGDYDMDVKSWIQKVWLQFSLDDTIFTVHIERAADGQQAYLAMGAEGRGMEDLPSIPGVMETMSNSEEIKATLHRFFFQRLGLTALGWTQAVGGVAERRNASWRTFFQALVIPDGSDEYLICNAQHATGGQDNIILSVFLGLSFAEALNQLLVEKQTATKASTVSEDEVKKAQEEAKVLEGEIKQLQQQLAQLDGSIRARRKAVETDTSTQRLVAFQSEVVQKAAEQRHLEEERAKLNRRIQKNRASAKNYREYIKLHLHFTGLDVHLCPNCDTDVDDAAVAREEEEHLCRLCGKSAHMASPTEIEAMEAQADAVDDQVASDVRLRDQINRDIDRLDRDIRRISDQISLLEGAARNPFEFALPTPEEEAEKARLLESIGALRLKLSMANHRAHEQSSVGDEKEIWADVQEKVRNTLRQVAEEQNAGILSLLGSLTQDMARAFGAQSITDVTVSGLGSFALRKHGVRVTYKSINNPGERLRVKMAFFLAMMRLGRLGGTGRHPGFLLIDQPASAEMVTEDVEVVVGALRDLDANHADDLQIICFTARSEFTHATASEKVWLAQAPPYAF